MKRSSLNQVQVIPIYREVSEDMICRWETHHELHGLTRIFQKHERNKPPSSPNIFTESAYEWEKNDSAKNPC